MLIKLNLVCSKCGLEKLTENFSRRNASKSGFQSQCKDCHNIMSKKWYEENKEEITAYHKVHYHENKKELDARRKNYAKENKKKIAEYKKIHYQNNKEEIAEYKKMYYQNNKEEIAAKTKIHRQNNKEEIAAKMKIYYQNNREEIAARVNLYYESNKKEIATKSVIYRQENKEEIAAKMKIYYQNNREEIATKLKIYRQNHKEERASYDKLYKQNNPHKKRANESRRRASKVQATPTWTSHLQKLQIEALHNEAVNLELFTGIKHHVDHIHPLNPPKIHYLEEGWFEGYYFEAGKVGEICGLEVPCNLRVITEAENCSKSNKFQCYVVSDLDLKKLNSWEII